MRTLAIIAAVALIALGCKKRQSVQSTPPPAQTAPATGTITTPKLQVKVLSDGSLFVDGHPATLATIDQQFGELAKVNGVVWYYREAGQSEPPPVATRVIALVMKHKLPISMSSKPDFSDAVDENGISHPRR